LGRDSPPSGRAFRPKATPLGLGRGFSALGKAITWGEEKQPMNDWLVVLTILKIISQWEGLSHFFWKNKKCSKPPTRVKYGV
jgi:hypothetical protein